MLLTKGGARGSVQSSTGWHPWKASVQGPGNRRGARGAASSVAGRPGHEASEATDQRLPDEPDEVHGPHDNLHRRRGVLPHHAGDHDLEPDSPTNGLDRFVPVHHWAVTHPLGFATL